MGTRSIPDGYHSITPVLVVRDAEAAIEFYRKAFDAADVVRIVDAIGRTVHAVIKVGDSMIMIEEEDPRYNRSPQSLGDSPVIIHLYVEDVDALALQAVGAGAKVLIAVDDQFYGDRSGRLEDPFGHTWIISTHTEDLTTSEMQRRFNTYMRKVGNP